MEQSTDKYRFAQFSPDGSGLLTWTDNGRTPSRFYDPSNGTSLGQATPHVPSIYGFSDNGKFITLAGEDGFGVWELHSGMPIGPRVLDNVLSVTPWEQGVEHLMDLARDGTAIVTPYRDRNTLCLWDVRTWKMIGRPMSHSSRLSDLIFSPDGKVMLTMCDDGTAHLWDVRTSEAIGTPLQVGDNISAAVFSPDGRSLAITADRRARLWDIPGCKALSPMLSVGKAIEHYQGYVSTSFVVPRFSPDSSKLLLPAIDDSGCQLFESRTGAALGQTLPHNRVNFTDFSEDSRKIITTSVEDGVVRLWDTQTTELLTEYIPEVPRKVFGEAAFIRGTNSISFGGGVWASWNGQDSPEFGREQTFVADVDDFYSPSTDLKFQENADLLVADLMQEKTTANAQPFRDERTLVANEDGSIDVFDSSRKQQHAEPKKLASLVGHGPGIRTAEFTPDHTRIVTAGDDRTLRFWDANTFKQMAVFTTLESIAKGQFSPDGTRLIIQFIYGDAVVWDSRPTAERRKMWARRAAERTPAQEYVAKLLASTATTQPAELKKLVRDDPGITPLRKLVAIEVLDLELRKRQREVQLKPAGTQPATKP